MKMRVILANSPLVFALTLFFIVSTKQEAQAIPAWARKYKTSCSTCHVAFPRLTAVGEAFRLNGYKFSNDEELVKEDKVILGREENKDFWPDSIWPSDIPGLPPIALRIISDFNAPVGGKRGRETATEFEFPKEAKLLSGGTFGDNLSFFLELKFEVEDGETETDLAVAFLQWEDLVGPENMLNFRVGVMGMQEFGLFTARDHNSLTAQPYLYTMAMLPSANGGVPGPHFMLHHQPGIELNGFGSRWRYAVGITQGAGHEENNSAKDQYFQLAYKIGGLGFDGSGASEAGGVKGWIDDSVTLSVFGYRGLETLEDENADPVIEGDNSFWRLGAGALWKEQSLEVGGGWIVGFDDSPYSTATDESAWTRNLFIEAAYFVYPWLIPSVRYEDLRFIHLPEGVDIDPRDQDRARVIASIKMLMRTNIAVILEGRFYTKDERFTEAVPDEDRNQDDLVLLRLDMAF